MGAAGLAQRGSNVTTGASTQARTPGEVLVAMLAAKVHHADSVVLDDFHLVHDKLAFS